MQDLVGDRDRLEFRTFHADDPVMRLGGDIVVSVPSQLQIKNQAGLGSLRDPGGNFNHIPIRNRLAEPAPDLDPREADLMPAKDIGPRMPQCKEKLLLGNLKEPEEIPVVNDPRRVTIGPVNTNLCRKFFNCRLLYVYGTTCSLRTAVLKTPAPLRSRPAREPGSRLGFPIPAYTI